MNALGLGNNKMGKSSNRAACCHPTNEIMPFFFTPAIQIEWLMSHRKGFYWMSENSTLTKAANGIISFIPADNSHFIRWDSDTRTHVVYEILETEKSYVESLQTLTTKYMGALKSTDYNGVVEGGIVDEIFFQIPEILHIHEEFLESLTQRCTNWDVKFTVGDLFVEAFTKQQVIDTYTAFINNWKCAKDATKIATQAKPAFARFLEHMSREHKGKLALDALLIMPVQRIPRYELLLKELLKHTTLDHPDHHLLVQAQKEVHDLAVKINRVEREAFQLEQMQARVKEIENHIEGVVDLCVPERAFIRHDVVTIPGGLGTKKERCLFLFSDILLITSIKRRSTAMRKPSATPTSSPSQSPFSVLDSNKYKLLTKFSIDSMEIAKSNDVSLKRAMRDIATLEEDIHILNQIKDLVGKLSSHHQTLEDVVRDLTNGVSKQMLEKQNNDYSLISLEMTITTQERVESLTIQFTSPERRAVWSAAFSEAKQRLGRKLPPELKKAMPIRKTRAGLQFTCAAATLGCNQQGMREVWVCNSDGYVGQVCVLSLVPEPTVMSCNGVCNARILTIASIPAACTMVSEKSRWKAPAVDTAAGVSIEVQEVEEEAGEDAGSSGNIQLDSESSDDDDDETESADEGKEERKRGSSIPREEDDMDNKQPTMWLGTEDGCIHVYNCNDNIRTKKNKIKIQHSAAIQCIITDTERFVLCMVTSGLGVWISATPSAVIRLFHATSYEPIFDVNVAPTVAKILSAATDDIIKQHKSACLRVTALLACKDLLWIGTSAGVILTLPLPHLTSSTIHVDDIPSVTGLPHGHTGHVRFLTCVEMNPGIPMDPAGFGKYSFRSSKSKDNSNGRRASTSASTASKLLVISGGDGYEDFSTSGLAEQAGHDDSTNHLLLWNV
ncbi:rho guanine nucleotide exchange factor 17 [Trichonephila inaurata madagascariensis]|uniref:Rho guanine nucleotide exchange factor 17 n=1 Tax=Trichonephila inaurata madagascariensis TaxID=2747483 RepID=A0A8X6XDH4_9ARAC|nr:rho guanine nucleotide exchange factor 17 [Trichonephila inaurata madagascariensis]